MGREIKEREGGEEGGRGRRERKGTRKEREREDEERGGGQRKDREEGESGGEKGKQLQLQSPYLWHIIRKVTGSNKAISSTVTTVTVLPTNGLSLGTNSPKGPMS